MIVEDDGDEWTDTDDPEEPLQTAKKQADRLKGRLDSFLKHNFYAKNT